MTINNLKIRHQVYPLLGTMSPFKGNTHIYYTNHFNHVPFNTNSTLRDNMKTRTIDSDINDQDENHEFLNIFIYTLFFGVFFYILILFAN